MKIFPPAAPTSSSTVRETRTEKNRSGKTGIVRKKQALPPKQNLSPDEIKEKLASHVETSGKSLQKAKNATARLGEGFMNDAIVRPPEIVPLDSKPAAAETIEETAEVKKDLLLKSDIAANDPRDTNTQEKLKTVLSKGAFSFNPKEKEILEKILS